MRVLLLLGGEGKGREKAGQRRRGRPTDDGCQFAAAALCEADAIRRICLHHSNILEIEDVKRDGEEGARSELNYLKDCDKLFPPRADAEGSQAVVVVHDCVH